jgi:hypothetical protein
MAELTNPTPVSDCCSAAVQESCCEPAVKDACCGDGSCGCGATVPQDAGELREKVRARYAAAATATTIFGSGLYESR